MLIFCPTNSNGCIRVGSGLLVIGTVLAAISGYQFLVLRNAPCDSNINNYYCEGMFVWCCPPQHGAGCGDGVDGCMLGPPNQIGCPAASVVCPAVGHAAACCKLACDSTGGMQQCFPHEKTDDTKLSFMGASITVVLLGAIMFCGGLTCKRCDHEDDPRTERLVGGR